MDHILQSFGAISVAILALGLAIIPVVWPYSTKHTFSQHIARHRSSTIYYCLLFTLFLPLFLSFFIGWFIPHFHLPPVLILCIAFVALTQYICTFIPETTGWKRQWHRVLAGGSAFGLIPIVASLLLLPYLSITILVYCSLTLMILLPIAFLHPYFHKFGESYIIQAIYYAAFFIPVLITAYLL